MRDWAVWLARAGFNSLAVLSSNDPKTWWWCKWCSSLKLHIETNTYKINYPLCSDCHAEHENISLQLAAPLSIRDENHLTLPLLGVFVGQTFVLGT